jgi:hypothetical protein
MQEYGEVNKMLATIDVGESTAFLPLTSSRSKTMEMHRLC